MRDELPMKDDSAENPPDNASGESAAQDDVKQQEPGNNEILINSLEIGGGLIFGVLGVEVSDAGFHIWGYLFDSAALACGIALLVHHIKKTGFNHCRKLFWSLVAKDFILFMFSTLDS